MHSLLFAYLLLPQQAAAVTLENVPPVVVSTQPVAGAGRVPANTTQIQVAFS